MNRVCDIRELACLDALRAWARAHRATVVYSGPDTEGRPVYIARAGVVERVARGAGPDPHAFPLTWRSPLETGRKFLHPQEAPVLDALVHRRWVLTIEGTPPHTEYVAYRPFGWAGPSDPHERIAAPTRPALLRALVARQQGETLP